MDHLFKGNVDSILFGMDNDEKDAVENSVAAAVFVDTEDDELFEDIPTATDTPTTTGAVGSPEEPTPVMTEEVRATVDLLGSKRLNFYDSDSDDDLDDHVVDPDLPNPLVEKLKMKLEKVRTNLKSERTNRKRKEKSLIKLAKELNARSNTYKAKDTTIEELEETISDLTGRLEARSLQMGEIPHLRAAILEKEKALLGYRDVAHSHLLTRLSQNNSDETASEFPLRNSNRIDQVPSLASIDSTMDDQTSTASPLSSPAASKPQSNRSSWVALAVAALLFLVGSAGAGFYVYENYGTTIHTIACAPIAPGTSKNGDDNSPQRYGAPFWVPLLYKRTVFERLCAQPRVALRWQPHRLQVVAPDGSVTESYRARNGFTVHYDSITLHQRTRDVEIPAPWWPTTTTAEQQQQQQQA